MRTCLYFIWHDWKEPERKRKNLMRLGIDYGHAYAWSRTRMGGWAVVQSPILVTTITLKRLQTRGYVSMLDYYTKVSPQVNEPLYARPAWFTMSLSKGTWCERHTPPCSTGGAAYSISSSVFYHCLLIVTCFTLSLSNSMSITSTGVFVARTKCGIERIYIQELFE